MVVKITTGKVRVLALNEVAPPGWGHTKAEKNKAFADRAKKAGYKSTQDYANVVARYGSEENMKKGKGLGT